MIPLDDRELLQLYSLAYTLVPNPNVAGDLFVTSRNPADLGRRARRWRQENGLALAAAGAAGQRAAPPLEEFEHLLSQRRRRERLHRTWWAGGALVVLLAGILLRWPQTGLAADRAFTGKPASASAPAHGLQLLVYRAEATPGSITVWWGVEGPGAGRPNAGYETPLIRVDGGEWVPARHTDTGRSGQNHRFGRTVYPVVTDAHTVTIRNPQYGWEASSPLVHAGQLTPVEQDVQRPSPALRVDVVIATPSK